MHRRSLFALPLLVATPFAAPIDWRGGVSELRFGISCLRAGWLSQDYTKFLRVPVRGFSYTRWERGSVEPSTDLVDAFVAGQVEFVSCFIDEAEAIAAAMGSRALQVAGNAFVLRSLPTAMRSDIIEALEVL